MAPPYVMKYVPFGQSGVAQAEIEESSCDYYPGCGEPNEYLWDNDGPDCDPSPSFKVHCVKWNLKSGGKLAYCPQVGNATDAAISGDHRSVACTYNSINDSVALNTLDSLFDSGVVNQISADRCDAKDFNGLQGSGECQTYYGRSLNYQLLKRLQATNKQWAFNANARTFINQVIKEEPTVTSVTNTNSPAADKATATQLVQQLCDAYPGGISGLPDLCSCYNTVKYGPQGCNNTYPGCKTVNAAKAALQALNATVQITGATDFFCLSSNCQDARNGSNSNAVLLKDTPHTCSINSLVCIQDFTRANFNNSSLSTSCRNELTTTTNNGGGGGGGGGTPSSPPSNGGAPAPARSKTPLLIGGAVACLCFIFLILIISLSSG